MPIVADLKHLRLQQQSELVLKVLSRFVQEVLGFMLRAFAAVLLTSCPQSHCNCFTTRTYIPLILRADLFFLVLHISKDVKMTLKRFLKDLKVKSSIFRLINLALFNIL